MDAFVSLFQSPWAVVVALVVTVLIGVAIRLAVSARHRRSDDVTARLDTPAPVGADTPEPTESDEDGGDEPRAGPEVAEETESAVGEQPAASVERPEPVRGRMERLRERHGLSHGGAQAPRRRRVHD